MKVSKTRQKEIRKKYTRVAKMGNQWNTYLEIDQQGFCVVEETSKKRAEWYAKMLSVALERMINKESKNL